ncbi:MAG: acyltransferase family protein [Lachnospiraceae bacterium]|nr:acyltransferase family protein [Lachnospiraceae bacterium]
MTDRPIREHNMDLERLILTVFVVITHYNNRDMGGALNFIPKGTAYEILIRVAESIAMCSVDAFLILSGYFAAKKAESGQDPKTGIKLPYRKAIWLLLTCSFYRVTGYICYLIFVTPGEFSLRTLIGYIIPNNWYVGLFVTILLLSPFIDRLLAGMDDRGIKVLTGVLLLLFCAVPMFVTFVAENMGADVSGLSTVTWHGDSMGFNICVFLTCYVVGYMLRKWNSYLDRFKFSFYMILFLLTVSLTAALSHFAESIWYYSSLMIVFEAAVFTLAFTRISISDGIIGKAISILGGGSLGVFLWHTMPVMFVGLWGRFDLYAASEIGFGAFVGTCTAAIAIMYLASMVWVVLCRTLTRALSLYVIR